MPPIIMGSLTGRENTMEAVGFTHDWYRGFLEELLADGRRFRGYDADLEDGDVLLRHDVDLSLRKSLEMAELEADLGVESTYFVLCSTPMYNPLYERSRSLLERIEALGHDVGLHFSTHQYWDATAAPSESELAARIEGERTLLDQVASDPVDIVSFHIPPEWVLRRTFDSFESTYEPRFFSAIGYAADSNQRWRDDPPVVAELPERVQILTHPGLWDTEDASFDDRIHAVEDERHREILDYTQSRYLEGLN